MKNTFLTALVVLLSAAPSLAAVQLSTSSTNANQGNSLMLGVGESGSMFIWVSTNAGQTIAGIGMDVLSSDANVLQASSYTYNNAATFWASTNPGTLGDLVTNANAFALPGIIGTGISTSGQNDFVLFSQVQFTATGVGSTTLSLAANANGFGDLLGNDLSGSLQGVTGSVVGVPEPGSLAVIVGLLGLSAVRRRRQP